MKLKQDNFVSVSSQIFFTMVHTSCIVRITA